MFVPQRISTHLLVGYAVHMIRLCTFRLDQMQCLVARPIQPVGFKSQLSLVGIHVCKNSDKHIMTNKTNKVTIIRLCPLSVFLAKIINVDDKSHLIVGYHISDFLLVKTLLSLQWKKYDHGSLAHWQNTHLHFICTIPVTVTIYY